MEKYSNHLVKEGQLVNKAAPNSPNEVAKWPGFHSKVFPIIN